MIRPTRLRLPAAILASWSLTPTVFASTPRPVTTTQAAAGAPSNADHQLGRALSWRVQAKGHTEVDYSMLARTLLDGLGQNQARTTHDVAAGRQRSTYEIGATLHLSAVSIIPGGAVYVGRLTDIDARFDGASDRRTTELGAPFMVQVDDQRGVRAFRFPRQYPESLARTVRSLVTPLIVALPSAGGEQWVTDEATENGLYEVRHALVGAHRIERTRRPVRTPSAIEVHQGQTVSELRLDGHGLVSTVSMKEDLTTQRDQMFVGRHVGAMSAERVSANADLPKTFAAAESALADDTFARARLYEVEPHFAPRVEGRTPGQMVAEFTKLVGPNAAQAHAILMNHVRRFPNAAAEILKTLAARPTESDDPAVVVGFAAVAAAGHVEAQRALVDALKSGDARTRERALISIMDLEIPEGFVLDAVWQTRMDFVAAGPRMLLSQSVATNVFGALGDVRRGNAETTERVVATLRPLLASPDKAQRIMALDALANVGDYATLAPLAAPHFAANDPSERVAAFVTFRRMQGDAAFEAFASRFAAEKDAGVLREAALIARDMESTTARANWAVNQLSRISDSDVLIPIVRLVGDDLATRPANEQALRHMLATQKDRKVRREIYAFVSPSPKGGAQ